jgi:oligoendopeptidase F
MNAVGLHGDVETLLHEGGHAFHAVACRDEPLVQYRHCTMEMAEVASMGMELLAYDHLDVFYNADDLARARREQMESIVGLFPWIATIDAFQQWLYTGETQWLGKAMEPEAQARGLRASAAPASGDRNARTRAWLSLMDLYGGIEDWTGYAPAREALWQRQLHLFGVPFYYIEYGIAQIGALQLWQNARKDKKQALRQYREALSLGGSRPLPELWAAAGLKFDFSEATLRPLLDAVTKELQAL